jgi:hypothetical protein
VSDSKVVKSAGRKPPAAGKGRQKGVLNKTTATVKEAMVAVYADLQASRGRDHGHFSEWAKANPTEFYKLYAKLLPTEINANHSGQITLEALVTASLDAGRG